MSRLVAYDALHDFVRRCLAAVSLPEIEAGLTADALASTDAMGVFTHGTKLLSGYLRKLQGGGYRVGAQPQIEREGPAWAVVDGQSVLGQVGSHFAMQLAMKKARETGVAWVGLRNVGHIGAAGYQASVAAQAGFISMICGNDIPSVAVPGSRKAVLGSNPLAYGIPVSNGYPILLDIATAAVAGGKVYAAHQRGEPIPDTWLIGPDGHPTTDGSLYPAEAALAPMAGHKGYGMSLWCELLAGVLPGGHLTWQVGSWMFDPPDRPSWHNASILAIDVNTIAPREQFDARLQQVIGEIHEAPRAEGVEKILLPGEREWEQYHQSLTSGIPLPADVLAKLNEAAEMTGVAPL